MPRISARSGACKKRRTEETESSEAHWADAIMEARRGGQVRTRVCGGEGAGSVRDKRHRSHPIGGSIPVAVVLARRGGRRSGV